ncbi:DUF6325 family protein [Demequina lignilytica]|uniref:DUF6325 family protein n=1 Tax=Demequina lignilytica TaxID=3051663 RepID=A0AAW7MAP1_9MICO|nr:MULTISPECIES: DUF6325 family protein [unclassified Demequina]MDN4479130.1 DUF6325 family protein [Demequina sp. SYSU T00039-1]MDN4482568.1 DUF6325 family protein [Demequina sp. SYSU T0a273]MDN4489157.1 DUF6325 family protein [Demequina sp. SYSU T00039]MDN4490260.1 DUF6325 family protein [Demequina sp. SYSU T00068]
MTLGPVEIVTIGFAHGRFDGSIMPELERLVASGTISIVDGVVVRKDAEDSVEILELEEATDDPAIAQLGAIVREIDGLLNDEDVEALIDELPVGAAAAVLCFEHTWVKPLRDAITAAGGELLDSVRVPGPVVQEVLDAIGAEA